MSSNFCKGLPLFVGGTVVKGFGRGSKELGTPTANYPIEVVDRLPKDLNCGIYFGWANVNMGPIFKMVMSVGWNPYYKNIKKSMETHILHEFDSDFYGALLKVVILGFIRPEKNFSSLDDLISEIKKDIEVAQVKLDEPLYFKFKSHEFFHKEDEIYVNSNGHSIL